MLTQIFKYSQPHDYAEGQKLLERQREIVDGLSEMCVQGDDLAVLRTLNEYGEIGRLGERFHSSEDCLKLYEVLVAGGYEAEPPIGEYFDDKDSSQVALYLIGQAMEEMREGRPPPGIFVVRSSMALNGVEPARWQMVINNEILMI